MTREEAKQILPIIQAFAEGKTIEIFVEGKDEWQKLNEPSFDLDADLYRIKPEPKYRPFRTQEECWNEMHKHPDFGWICRNEGGAYVAIQEVGEYIDSVSFKDILDTYTFTDGEPFGIKEE